MNGVDRVGEEDERQLKKGSRAESTPALIPSSTPRLGKTHQGNTVRLVETVLHGLVDELRVGRGARERGGQHGQALEVEDLGLATSKRSERVMSTEAGEWGCGLAGTSGEKRRRSSSDMKLDGNIQALCKCVGGQRPASVHSSSSERIEARYALVRGPSPRPTTRLGESPSPAHQCQPAQPPYAAPRRRFASARVGYSPRPCASTRSGARRAPSPWPARTWA